MTTPPDVLYRLIPLTQGQSAMVDVDDYEWLVQFKWFARWDANVQGFYACRNGKRYGPRSLGKREPQIQMHRQILNLASGDKRLVDHVNRNTLDNRRSNIRIATYSQNTHNTGLRSTNKTGLKGVSLHGRTGKYQATMRADGKQLYLGLYSTKEEAYEVVKAEMEKRRGEFCRME